MIEGIRHSRAGKMIWRHNDPEDLRKKLSKLPKDAPKIVAFESVYSMDGDIAPIDEICDVASEFGAMTYLDEVHAVGLYGEKGGGISQQENVANKVDLIALDNNNGFNLNEVPLSTKGKSGKSSASIPLT